MISDDNFIVLSGGGSPLPKPTREQICGMRISFQGVTVNTQQYGTLPLFDPVIGWFSGPSAAADRQACYAAKREMGDNAVNLAVSAQYRGADTSNAYCNIPGRDFTNDLAALHDLCSEAINNGFYVLLMCAGDGESVNSNPQYGDYNDPNGWTYGQQWLMQNFQRIYDALADLAPWIVFCPGYDGVVPAWQPPSQVDDFAFMARAVLGESGYLALELSNGYCVWAGNEANNWEHTSGQCFDLILSEFPPDLQPPTPPPPNFLELSAQQRAPWDQVWQIVARCVQPYDRPSEQPAGDDPNPPFNLETGTPRGPYFYNAFEYLTYLWVRRQCSVEDVQTKRVMFANIGCVNVG